MSDDIQAVPDYPENQQISSTSTSNAIKIATPDLILLDGATLPVDLMTDLLFENIGGQEIISISRNDIVNGQEVSYNLIGNTGLLNRQYNTKNIFSVSGTLDTYFGNFSIRLDTHIPEEGTGPPANNRIVVSKKLESNLATIETSEAHGLNVGTNIIISAIDYTFNGSYVVSVINSPTSFSYLKIAADIPVTESAGIVRFGNNKRAYVEESSGDIVIDITNMEVNERLDVEVLKEGFRDHGTIYVGES